MKQSLKVTLPFLLLFLMMFFTYTVVVTAQSTTTSPSATATPPTDPPVTSTPPGECGRFQDVEPGSPFYSYIQCLGCNGSVEGYACSVPPAPACQPGNLPYFLPGANMTRAQLVKIVVINAKYNDVIPTSTQTFSDVPSDNPFWLYIEQAYAHNVVSGYPCGGTGEVCDPQNRPYFRPQTNVSRAQAVKIVITALASTDPPNPPLNPTFADIPTTSPFYVVIEQAASMGLVVGYTCGGINEPCDSLKRPYFRPNELLTRQQGAKLVALGFNCVLNVPSITLTPGTCARRPEGDTNCDDVVNMVDYLYYLRYVNNGPLPVGVDLDVNGDGQVNAVDRSKIIDTIRAGGAH